MMTGHWREAFSLKWPGFNSKCAKRMPSRGHSIPTAWPMWDTQVQSARLIASQSAPTTFLMGCFKVSAFPSLSPI